jgi:hypothetical protein
MTFSRRLSANPELGTEHWFHADGDKVHIEMRQSGDAVAAILEANKRQRNEFQGYKDKGEHHFHHYATIPWAVMAMWREQYGIDVFNPDHAAGVKRLLNDGEWRYLRTTEGTV